MSRARDIANLQSSKITADFGIDIDNINIDGTEIDLSSGDLTIDVAGNISLDADDVGQVRFKDGGAEYLSIYEDASNNPIIQASIADTNILFKGTDTGVGVITALDLDIHNSGFATFNANAHFNESGVDTDFRIKSVNQTNMFYVDANTDRIGIGTSSPGARLQVDDGSGRNLQIAPSGSGIDIISTTNPMRLITSDASNMTFSINGSSNEAMRIDTSQNLMVGKTTLGISNVGHTLAAAGYVEFTRDGAAALNVGRNSSFGDIADFWKDGVNVGSIGTPAANELYIEAVGSNSSGLTFNSANAIQPRKNSAADDGNIDLGTSGNKFKDAHFAGIVDCAEITYNHFDTTTSGSGLGSNGLNVVGAYSYDDNNTNTIGSGFSSNFHVVYVTSGIGSSAVPILGNAGGGVAWANYLWDPDNQTWTSANDVTWTMAGTNGNTFRIQINAGVATATITRTSGSLAYRVRVSRIGGEF